jgi:hypothetical protein
MRNGGTISNLRRVRAWLGQALVVAIVLRALIPAGFMPVLSEPDGGGLKIVICTAHGTKLVAAVEDGGSDTRSAAKHAGEPCAFVSLATLPAPDSAVSQTPGKPNAPAYARHAAGTLPPARAGPANGSRAPPALT